MQLKDFGCGSECEEIEKRQSRENGREIKGKPYRLILKKYINKRRKMKRNA